jgi:hypothetical protein
VSGCVCVCSLVCVCMYLWCLGSVHEGRSGKGAMQFGVGARYPGSPLSETKDNQYLGNHIGGRGGNTEVRNGQEWEGG